jgi:hypothetical protein
VRSAVPLSSPASLRLCLSHVVALRSAAPRLRVRPAVRTPKVNRGFRRRGLLDRIRSVPGAPCGRRER